MFHKIFWIIGPYCKHYGYSLIGSVLLRWTGLHLRRSPFAAEEPPTWFIRLFPFVLFIRFPPQLIHVMKFFFSNRSDRPQGSSQRSWLGEVEHSWSSAFGNSQTRAQTEGLHDYPPTCTYRNEGAPAFFVGLTRFWGDNSQKAGPSVADILRVIGRERSLERLTLAKQNASNSVNPT